MPRLEHAPSRPPTGKATENALTAPLRGIAPEDYFKLTKINGLSLSPSGRRIAYRTCEWVDKESVHRLWAMDTGTSESISIVQGTETHTAPQWSSDELTVYYGAPDGENADAGSQVWSVRIDGSNPEQVTHESGGIARFAVSTRGRAIYFAKNVKVPASEWSELRERFRTSVAPGHGDSMRTDMWRLDLVGGKRTLLHAHDRFVTSFAVSPDESRLAMATSPDDRLISNEGESRIEILDLETGDLCVLPDELWRDRAPAPFGWVEEPVWSPDGTRVVFRVGHDAFPSEIIVADVSGDRPSLVKIPRPLECHPLRVGWNHDGSRLLLTASHRSSLSFLAVDSEQFNEYSFLESGDVAVEEFATARGSDMIAILKSSPESLPEIFLTGSRQEQLTAVHRHTSDWEFPSLQRIKWSAPDETEIEGILELPPGYEPGAGPLPTLVILHGGPTDEAVMARTFGIRGHTAFAARGYAVFQPNFRGSRGYGDDFLSGLVGRINDIDITDILSGIDALVTRKTADPERLGMMGWSYGGYLVNCLLATNRFKAASSGAGAFDMGMQFGEMDTPGHTVNLLGGFPWEVPDNYQKASPLYFLRPGIKTATLIHSGSRDKRVPHSQARALYRILSNYLDAPCELLAYSGTGHQLSDYEHQLARLTWDHAWFEKYLA